VYELRHGTILSEMAKAIQQGESSRTSSSEDLLFCVTKLCHCRGPRIECKTTLSTCKALLCRANMKRFSEVYIRDKFRVGHIPKHAELTSLSLQQGSRYPRHQSVAPQMTARYSFFSSTPHFNDSRGVLQCVLAIKAEFKSVKMSRS
jgi:hypothetical protein